jgi:hypothetical protein
MSILKGVAVFLLSAIFTFSLFMGITSYTIGGLLQKENLKSFIESGMAPDLVENQCNNLCSDAGEQKQSCLDRCIEEMGNQTDQTVSSVVDSVYNTEFYGVSINQITLVLNQLVLFIAIALISGVAIFFVSEEPLSTLGRNMISISVTLFITALSPNFILSLSNVPIQGIFSDYMSRGLELQNIFAVLLLVVAIVFIITDYLIKRKRKK